MGCSPGAAGHRTAAVPGDAVGCWFVFCPVSPRSPPSLPLGPGPGSCILLQGVVFGERGLKLHAAPTRDGSPRPALERARGASACACGLPVLHAALQRRTRERAQATVTASRCGWGTLGAGKLALREAPVSVL